MLRDYAAHFVSSDMPPFKQVKVAIRSDDLKYAVGMIMKHTILGYRCVIYDWDPECLASVEWQRQNDVYRLELQGRQPFYNVLVEDGSHKYVAQGENIEFLIFFFRNILWSTLYTYVIKSCSAWYTYFFPVKIYYFINKYCW